MAHDDQHSPAELRERLTKEIKDAKFGMLGLVGGSEMHHFQPMACEVEDNGDDLLLHPRRQRHGQGLGRHRA